MYSFVLIWGYYVLISNIFDILSKLFYLLTEFYFVYWIDILMPFSPLFFFCWITLCPFKLLEHGCNYSYNLLGNISVLLSVKARYMRLVIYGEDIFSFHITSTSGEVAWKKGSFVQTTFFSKWDLHRIGKRQIQKRGEILFSILGLVLRTSGFICLFFCEFWQSLGNVH